MTVGSCEPEYPKGPDFQTWTNGSCGKAAGGLSRCKIVNKFENPCAREIEHGKLRGVDLKDVRIIQRNLCYVVGLPCVLFEQKELLGGSKYFGRYGKVRNLTVRPVSTLKGALMARSCAVYVTFESNVSAALAIMDLDGRELDGCTVQASCGATKYCLSFLSGSRCCSPRCIYLHELANPSDCFTVQQLKEAKDSLNCVLKNSLSQLMEEARAHVLRVGDAAVNVKLHEGGVFSDDAMLFGAKSLPAVLNILNSIQRNSQAKKQLESVKLHSRENGSAAALSAHTLGEALGGSCAFADSDSERTAARDSGSECGAASSRSAQFAVTVHPSLRNEFDCRVYQPDVDVLASMGEDFLEAPFYLLPAPQHVEGTCHIFKHSHVTRADCIAKCYAPKFGFQHAEYISGQVF